MKLFSDATAPLDVRTQEADAVSLPRLDEVGGHPRPPGVGVTYAEHEYHALADEQELIWPAEGERAARPFLDLARDCHAAYLTADPQLRRLFNQAFFKHLMIDEDGVHSEYAEPFDTLLGGDVLEAGQTVLADRVEG